MPLALAWLAGTEGVALAPWCAALTVVVVAPLTVRALARGLRLHRATPWLAGLVAWACVAAVIRPVDRAQAAWLVTTGVVAVALSVVAAAPAGQRAAGWAVVAAGTAVAPWLLLQRLGLGVRPAGPFDDPNLGAALVVLAFAVLAELPLAPAWRAAAAALQLAGVLASGSRAGLLALMVVAACWAARSQDRRLRIAVVATVLLAAAGLAWRLASDRDPLRWERLRIWGAAGRTVVSELPFGAGPAGFRDAVLAHNFPRDDAFARYGRIPGTAESDALELAATLGVPGLALAVGLAASLVRAARGRPAAIGVLAAIVTTSAFHSLLDLPLLAWGATLAAAATAGRPRGARVRVRPLQALAGAALVAAPAAVALAWPRAALFPMPERLLRQAESAVAAHGDDDIALARAEAATLEACRLRPRSARGWKLLGDIRLGRALLLRQQALARGAAAAYERAAAANPLDAWAAFGTGRAEAVLGGATAARGWLQRALALEPNCVPAWLELARLDLEAGRMAPARARLARAEHIVATAPRPTFVSDYERALATPDPLLLARLRAALERP